MNYMPQNLENEEKYKKENNSEFRNSDITTFNMLLYTFLRFFPFYVLDNVSCDLHIYIILNIKWLLILVWLWLFLSSTVISYVFSMSLFYYSCYFCKYFIYDYTITYSRKLLLLTIELSSVFAFVNNIVINIVVNWSSYFLRIYL